MKSLTRLHEKTRLNCKKNYSKIFQNLHSDLVILYGYKSVYSKSTDQQIILCVNTFTIHLLW